MRQCQKPHAAKGVSGHFDLLKLRGERVVELDLVPGVRDRVQARLATMGVPADRAVSYGGPDTAGVAERSPLGRQP